MVPARAAAAQRKGREVLHEVLVVMRSRNARAGPGLKRAWVHASGRGGAPKPWPWEEVPPGPIIPAPGEFPPPPMCMPIGGGGPLFWGGACAPKPPGSALPMCGGPGMPPIMGGGGPPIMGGGGPPIMGGGAPLTCIVPICPVGGAMAPGWPPI